MPLFGLVPLAAALLSNTPVATNLPRLAPAQFVSTENALTFRTPPGSSYCPLPDDFVGAYHGPTLFLTPAARCGGTLSPRIAVGYGIWFSEAEVPREPCRRAGSIRLLGKDRPLCREEAAGMIRFEASARYSQDGRDAGGYEVTVYLDTTPKRLNADLATLRATAASVRVCRSIAYAIDEKGRRVLPHVSGHGAACPSSARFF